MSLGASLIFRQIQDRFIYLDCFLMPYAAKKKFFVNSDIFKELHILNHRYLLRIFIFLFLYLSSSATAIYCNDFIVNYGFLVAIPFYILAGASLHGICLFTHEGVHGTLHEIPWINNLIGSLTGYPVLQTLAGYRVLHLKHHKYLNIDGDPGLLENYYTNKYVIAAMEWGYFIFGYISFLSIIPFQGFCQGGNKDKILIVCDMLCITLMVIFIFWFLPINWVIHGWLIPLVYVHFMMNIRGMSQHLMLEDHHDPFKGTRTIIPHPVVTFFLCNENYHIEHHVYPGIPWYNLQKVHHILKPELKAKGSTIIYSFSEFIGQFVRTSKTRISA